MVRYSIENSEENEEQQDSTKTSETPENSETKIDETTINEPKGETSKNETQVEAAKNEAAKRETAKSDTPKKGTTKKDSKKVEHLAESFSKLKVGSRLKDEGYSELKSIARCVAQMEGDVRECRMKQLEMDNKVGQMEEFLHKSLSCVMRKLDALQNRSWERTPNVWWHPQLPSVFRPMSSSVLEAAERGDCEALLRFLAGGDTDIQERNPRGDTALHLAATGGHAKAVRLLLTAGAVSDAPGHRLRSPLHCAARNGHVECVERLLAAGAQADVADVDGATPLALAARGGHARIVGLLLAREARSDSVDIHGLAPIFRAATGGHTNVVQLLLDRGVSADICNDGDSLIVHAAKACQWKVVKLLLEKGVSVAKYSKPDESPLALAAKDGQGEIVRQLLKRGAATDEQQVESALNVAENACVVWALAEAAPEVVRGDPGKWGLLFAAEDGRLEALVALLEAGVDIQARDQSGITALHSAAWNGHFACVRELLQRGADVKWKDGNGDTALHKAALGDKHLCVRALLEFGACVKALNSQGESPKDVAASESVRRILDGGINAFDYSLNNPGRKRNSNTELFGNEKPGFGFGSTIGYGSQGNSEVFESHGTSGSLFGSTVGNVPRSNSTVFGSSSQNSGASGFTFGSAATGGAPRPNSALGIVNQPHSNETGSVWGVFGMGDQPKNAQTSDTSFGCPSFNLGTLQAQQNIRAMKNPFAPAKNTSQGGFGFGAANQQTNIGRSGSSFGSASNTFGVTNQPQGQGTTAGSHVTSVGNIPQNFGMGRQESNSNASGFTFGSFGNGVANGPVVTNAFGVNNQSQSNASQGLSFGVQLENTPRPFTGFGIQSPANATNNGVLTSAFVNTSAKKNFGAVNQSENNITKPFCYKVSRGKKISLIDTQSVNNDQNGSLIGSNAVNLSKDKTLGTTKESNDAATFSSSVHNTSAEKTVIGTSNQLGNIGTPCSVLGSCADSPQANSISGKDSSSSSDEKNDKEKEPPLNIVFKEPPLNILFKPRHSSNKSDDD